MKKPNLKIICSIFAVALLICISAGGTIAWLSVYSGSVTNTFTVGDINILLRENKHVATPSGGFLGSLSESEWVVSNDNYKIVPGASDYKNPTVFVEVGSEPCWVYILLKNELGSNISYTVADTPLTGWHLVESGTVGGTESKLYRYNSEVTASGSGDVSFNNISYVKLPALFTTVAYSTSITKENIANLDKKTVVVTAYAHQSAYISQSLADSNVIEMCGFDTPVTD